MGRPEQKRWTRMGRIGKWAWRGWLRMRRAPSRPSMHCTSADKSAIAMEMGEEKGV
jgi:hypothetical protein